MIKRFLRELYLLPRGEQRAVILVSLLLILSVLMRIGVHLLPGRDPPGMEEFVKESRMLMIAIADSDSIERVSFPQAVSDDDDQSTSGDYYRSNAHRLPPGKSSFHSPAIDLNRADSIGLLPLPGIGPVLAGRIIKYRNLLGGYINTSQLEDVYGLRMEVIDLIGDRIQVDTCAIRKINVDSASFREFLRHPYLEMRDVKALIKYRDFAGHINSIDELHEQDVLPDSTLERVSSYLYFND